MIKNFGMKESIFFHLTYEKEEHEFGFLSLIINNEEILNLEGNFSFLCVDLECFYYDNSSAYKDNFFWQKTEKEIIESWNLFFNSRTLEEIDRPEVWAFNDNFCRVKLPLDSTFFDEFVFIGYRDDEGFFHIKMWEKFNAQYVKDYSVSFEEFKKLANEISEFLRIEILD
ncbi:hypothetical protein WAF17_02075 [Bernardetia sp. ABR2-2B]|uniref:hypothetical protein n=1 Tax=Bernardetia sp. ABR2-2B TaxID=3127472 RepID=UPI0030D5D4A7